MADTQRTVSAILALLADNAAGDISPQDIRDAFVSWRMGHGQIYVAAADSGDITISDSVSYFEATAMTWTLSSGAHLWDESDGNGRLTYTGTVAMTCHIACTISYTCASSSQVLHWRIGKNGTTDEAGEVQDKIGTGTDVQSTAIHLITSVSNGDHISLFARNATSTANVTIEAANLQVVSMIQ
jgi:hypothetical protein